jgi:polysaccharide biosynthesis protein PslG
MLRVRPRAGLLASILVLTLAVCAGAGARVPQGFVGMVVGSPEYTAQGANVDLASQLDAMVATGVETVHVVFNWSYAQPYPIWRDVPLAQANEFTPGGLVPTRWGAIDQIVELATQRHLQLIPEVLYAPGWDLMRHAGLAQPASPQPYAAFLTALVDRYGPRGSFWATHSPKLPVRMWQIWNEPNISDFWKPQPFARDYVALLRAAHDAIKHADRGAKVVLAGLANFSWTVLQQIYAVPGARRLFDVVAVHPYTRLPGGVLKILGKVRAVMNAAGDRRKPIVADEISWPSSYGQTNSTDGEDFVTTEAGQAQHLARLLPMLARARRRLRLIGFDYFTWAGIEVRGGDVFDFAGLFRFSGAQFVPKPAFYAFRRAALGIERCRVKATIATRCATPS